MSTIFIDSLPEEQFRQSIESDLRHGRAAQTVMRLRTLLAEHAGLVAMLPERFLTVTSDDLVIKGWDYLGDCIARHDRPGRPVTAISIAFGWPGDDAPGTDDQGCLHPHIETAYFNDAAYPFSKSSRDDLLDGYSLHGCTWAADSEALDNALSVDGIDDLHGALAVLEAQLLGSEEPDEASVRAGSLGACLLSALLFQAVEEQIKRHGLPRPLCVTAGSNGVYPYFDAPVVGMPEQVRQAAIQAEEEEELADAGVPGPRYSSLLMTGIPRAQKRAVLVLAETEGKMAVRIANLRSTEPVGDGGVPPPSAPPSAPSALPPPDAQPSPLLAKKSASHGWDFRDMLGPPPEPAPPPPTAPPADLAEPPEHAEPPAPAPWQDAAWDAPEPDRKPDEPVLARKPARLPSIPTPEPGFSFIEPCEAETVQDRLNALIAPPALSQPAPTPDSAIETPPSAARVIADPWPVEAAGLAWPFGPEPGDHILSGSAPMVSEKAAQLNESPVRRSGLWARLTAWIRR